MLKALLQKEYLNNFYLNRNLIAFLLFFTVVSHSQDNTNSFITEYQRLLSVSKDSAMSYSNRLINSGKDEEKAAGLAGKAHVYMLKSDFDLADVFFKKSLVQLNLLKHKGIKIRSYILYLQSLRYIETHELETAINILNEAINFCAKDCSLLLEIKLQSALARTYSLSNNLFKALEISRLCLTKIKNAPNYLVSYNLKKEYTKELVNAANRSMNVYYYLDREKYKSYLDSTQRYITLAKNYSEKYRISNYNGTIALVNADINLYRNKYTISKQYYEEGLKIFEKRKHKKRVEQILFLIAKCDYNLKNWSKAEAIFLRQLDDDFWSEFQLLDNEALCYFYLFKIYEQRQQSKKALDYANKYVEEIKKHLKVKNASDIAVNTIVAHEKRKKEIETYFQNYQSQKRKKHIYLYFLLASIVFIGLLIAYFFRIKISNKRNIGLLNSRIKQLQQNVSKQNISNSSVGLTDENALKLIKKLKNLEKEQLFLHPNYTLALVAKKLNTNSSYLSKTVNNYLNLTFAEYSNRLKINSIVLRLKEQRNLKNYTIEALAKETGYKSVTSFNTNFKKLLKITPSQYLRELKRDK